MRILLCILLALCTSFTFAQTGNITGKVIDPETNEPLIGVTVLVEGTSKGEITGLDGSFTITNVPVGTQTLRIKYVGYEETTVEAVVADGQTISVGEVLLNTTAIGLQEVEVFANMVDDRRTPVAVSTISQLEIDERLGGMQLPELLNETPGIYATQGDGAFGDAYVNIRGFGQEEVLFMINGVPMNDMENGIMYWSNFAGLSEVTRNMQVQRGLGASKLAVNSVGGTINIVTLPSSRKKGGSADVIFGNATYANRYRFTLNSGLTKSGWAFTFQGSRSTGEGIRPGAYVNAWSYFLTASKQFNENHTFLFTAFGAPTDRGRAWNTNTATYEKFDNYMYNEAWGYLNGEKFNTSQNKSHKPQVTAMHVWNVNDKITVTSSLYASLARVYGTSVLRGQGAPAVGIT
ncbi:MAG TPA: TonB-dependent receptor, partial [Cyclobacteriaceae bacterium]|nr:TonB-dependent receptor [Cyclobacteriaceae bacterium]